MTLAEGIEPTLRRIVAEIGGFPPDFPADADLVADLGMDSFRLVEAFVAVEQALGITLSEDDYDRLRSLREFLPILQRAAP